MASDVLHLILLALAALFGGCTALRLGAVLRVDLDEHLRRAFMYAAERAKENILPARHRNSLEYHIDLVEPHQLTQAMKKACAQVENGTSVLFGPPDARLAGQLAAVAAHVHAPYASVGGDPLLLPPAAAATTVNFFPARHLFETLKDLVVFWKWQRLVLVYREDVRIIQLARFFEDADVAHVDVSLIKIDDDDYLEAAKRLSHAEQCSLSFLATAADRRRCKPAGFSRVLLDLDAADVYKFLLAALQVGLVELKHWYLMTSLNMLDMDMEMFRHNHARFVGMDLGHARDKEHTTEFLAHMRDAWKRANPSATYFPAAESMLMYDAVTSVATAYARLLESGVAPVDDGQRAQCGLRGRPARYTVLGEALYQELHKININGMTGSVVFSGGERTNVSFNIQLLGFNGNFSRIGYWESSNPDTVNVSLGGDAEMQLKHNLVVTEELKPHMRVTTIEERPYIMMKRNHYQFKGNNKYEGFCIDLLTRLAEDLGFTYTIHLVADGKYGSYYNGSWNGMIGEILRDEADMAVAPLTVNYHRAEVVDFTKPFLSLGISILYRIPDELQPNLFSFLNPLSPEIWLWILVAAVSVTLGMFVIARLTPFEWNPTVAFDYDRPVGNSAAATIVRRDDTGAALVELTNNYSFFNTLWYVVSTLLKGGCDFGPRAVSTRLLGGVWWVFTLIITSAYTANLAAVLTVDKRYVPIKSLEDLANQTDIKYGAVQGGSTSTFFRESKIPTHARMWQMMTTWQKTNNWPVMTSGNKEGVAKVLQHNYAYLMESASLEYEVQQNCNLTQVGGVLGSKGYGIALPKHSEWTDRVSRQILDYAERGVIEMVKTKWWRSKGGTCTGTASTLKENRLSLNMENVSGLFVVLLAGLLCAVVCVAAEFCLRSKKNAQIDKTSVWREMLTELKFALRLHDPVAYHVAKAGYRQNAAGAVDTGRAADANSTNLKRRLHDADAPAGNMVLTNNRAHFVGGAGAAAGGGWAPDRVPLNAPAPRRSPAAGTPRCAPQPQGMAAGCNGRAALVRRRRLSADL